MYSFNLVSEPWIPVKVAGKLEFYSLEKTLIDAAEIERIEDASPLVTVALHRFLLAVLYRALEGPTTLEDNIEWFEHGFPVERIKNYLEKWKPRFDLFDPERPFFQVTDLDQSGFNNQPKTWTELVAEISDGGQGSNIFNHENLQSEPIEPDLAIRILLSRQTFVLGGLSRTFVYSAKRSPSPNAIFVIPHGEKLLETLCYCLDPNNFALYGQDIPFWEEDNAVNIAILREKTVIEVMGCAQAYVWMSRSVKLVPEFINGAQRVKNVFFTSGFTPEFVKERYYDPMVGTQIIRSGENKGKYKFSEFREGHQFWRDFHSLFPSENKSGIFEPRVLSISARLFSELKKEINLGVYGICNATQEAKIDFARQERYLLPEAISANRSSDVYGSLSDATRVAEDFGENLGNAARALARKLLSRGSRKVDKADVEKLVNSFPTFATYWSLLEAAFSELLKRLTFDYEPEVVQRFWLEQIINASNKAWRLTREAAGDDAFSLRAIYAAENLLYKAQRLYQPAVQK